MPEIDTHTQLCAVIGKPIGHSLSPVIHNAAFAAANLNYAYLAFEVEDLRGFVTGLRAMPSFRGVSVTIPHKTAILGMLDELDPIAAQLGSVNTVMHEGDRLIGCSTDGPGALRALQDANVDVRGKKVLFLGSGGAVRAVALTMVLESEPAAITIAGRTPANVAELVDDLRSGADMPVAASDLGAGLSEAFPKHDIIIQGTSVGMEGMSPDDTLVLHHLLRENQTVFDMVYNPHETRLLQDAQAVGCHVVYGIEMLIHQAAIQFETWTGRTAPVAAMRDSVRARQHAKH